MTTLDIIIIIIVLTIAIGWLIKKIVILLNALLHPKIPVHIKLILTSEDKNQEISNLNKAEILIRFTGMVAVPTIGSVLIESGVRAKVLEVGVAPDYCDVICHMRLDSFEFNESVETYIEEYEWSRHSDDEVVNDVYQKLLNKST